MTTAADQTPPPPVADTGDLVETNSGVPHYLVNGRPPVSAGHDDDDENDDTWTVQERWLLEDGVEVIRELATLPYEPHLGDLNQYANRSAYELVSMGKTGNPLRIIADNSRIFLALPERVIGVYVELTDGYGEPVDVVKPGYAFGAVDPDGDDETVGEGDAGGQPR